MPRVRKGLLLAIIAAWLATGALALLITVALMRECGGPRRFLWPALAVVPASLAPGLWAAMRAPARWNTVVAFLSLAMAPAVALLLGVACQLRGWE